jgi:hypothetical protein
VSAAPEVPKAAGGGTRPFRVRFQGEAVLEAVDVRDALCQAEARSMNEITSVTLQD